MKNGRWMGLCAALLLCWAMPAEAKPKDGPASLGAASEAKAKKAKKKKKSKASKSKKKSKAKKSSSASAASSESRGVARVKQGGNNDYSYVFRDDPLAGANNMAGAARIRVRNHGARRTLMRPRLDFVPELLKSVEDI
ncbi:MAG: hypothetical protein JRI68_15200 [Deltaproteobacteria bacterium]|nr:hypothetical protein [Deltaproteobacteria bacterium]